MAKLFGAPLMLRLLLTLPLAIVARRSTPAIVLLPLINRLSSLDVCLGLSLALTIALVDAARLVLPLSLLITTYPFLVLTVLFLCLTLLIAALAFLNLPVLLLSLTLLIAALAVPGLPVLLLRLALLLFIAQPFLAVLVLSLTLLIATLPITCLPICFLCLAWLFNALLLLNLTPFRSGRALCWWCLRIPLPMILTIVLRLLITITPTTLGICRGAGT